LSLNDDGISFKINLITVEEKNKSYNENFQSDTDLIEGLNFK